MADDELAHRTALDQDLADKLLRRQLRDVAIEPKENNVIKRGLGQNFQSFRTGGQQWWRGFRVHHLQRVGLERNQEADPSRRPGATTDFPEHRLVPQMDPIKRSHGDDTPVGQWEGETRGMKRLGHHPFSRTTVGCNQPSSARAMAIRSPPSSSAIASPCRGTSSALLTRRPCLMSLDPSG